MDDFEYAVEDFRLPEFLGITSSSSTTAPSSTTGAAAPPTTTSTTAQGDQEIEKLMGGLGGVGEDELESLLRELEGK